MSDRTGIEWTDKTWNPWQGCTKVSSGCAHCYAEREHLKYKLPAFAAVRRSKTTFTAPLRWKEPAHVFTCSWSDFFHEAADAWRDEAWDIIRRTPHLTYQILTKRPERIAAHLPADWGIGYPNVWLGVSVETQRQADRIALLLEIPSAKHFLSCEPLLGPVSIEEYLPSPYGCGGEAPHPNCAVCATALIGVDWVIIGGESGHGARPMNLDWARTLRDQCAEAGVAFFLKQLGGHPDARAHEKATLDGVRHIALPEVRA